MTELKSPIRSLLAPGFAEEDVLRIWQGVERKCVRRPLERRWWNASYAMAAVAVVAMGVYVGSVAQPSAKSGPLELAEGGLPSSWTVGTTGASRSVVLSDGSSMSIAPGSHLEVINNDGSVFYSLLLNGKATFDVRPQGKRRWTVECGLATVEVLGTKFSCDLHPSELTVAVDRGVVLVRGERVPNRVQRLTAGSQLKIAATSSSSWGAASADAASAAPGEFAARASADPAASVVAPPSKTLSQLAERSAQPKRSSLGDRASSNWPAGAGAGRLPISGDGSGSGPTTPDPQRPRDSVEQMLAQADQARRSGDRSGAERLLDRVVREAPGDSRASIASFTLARLQMESRPAAAAHNLASALDRGLPRSLEEDALARLVEAQARSGNREQAARTAARYRSKFPQGSRLEEVRRWSEKK